MSTLPTSSIATEAVLMCQRTSLVSTEVARLPDEEQRKLKGNYRWISVNLDNPTARIALVAHIEK